MSFNSTLENLRAKPDHVRKQYSFWSAFGITMIIFAFWSASFTANVAGGQGTQVAATVDKVSTPGSALVASVGGFFWDIKDMIFGPKKVQYSTIEVLPGEK
jgi:hypothetical protein